MVFQKLNEINYFHILQTSHRARHPARVQLAEFICVANEPALAVLDGLPGLLLPRSERGEPSRGVIKSLLLWQADAE